MAQLQHPRLRIVKECSDSEAPKWEAQGWIHTDKPQSEELNTVTDIEHTEQVSDDQEIE